MVADSAGRGILPVQGAGVSYGSRRCRKGCLTCAGCGGVPMVADGAGRGVLPVQGAWVSYGSRRCRKGYHTCAGCGGFLW